LVAPPKVPPRPDNRPPGLLLGLVFFSLWSSVAPSSVPGEEIPFIFIYVWYPPPLTSPWYTPCARSHNDLCPRRFGKLIQNQKQQLIIPLTEAFGDSPADPSPSHFPPPLALTEELGIISILMCRKSASSNSRVSAPLPNVSFSIDFDPSEVPSSMIELFMWVVLGIFRGVFPRPPPVGSASFLGLQIRRFLPPVFFYRSPNALAFSVLR